MPALAGDPGVRLVGRQHDVRDGEGGPFGRAGHADPRAAAELLDDELGEQIVMVEHDPPAQRPRERAKPEEHVGRVVQMHDVGPGRQLPNRGRVQRGAGDEVLENERGGACALGEPEPADVHAGRPSHVVAGRGRAGR